MFLVVLIMENILYAAAALFLVDVPQSSYTVKLGGEVVMECRFPVKDTLKMEELMITWLHTVPSQREHKEVYMLHKGEEDLSYQDTQFIGRATLLKERLYTGAAQLHITNVSFSDRGTYICLIGYEGADHKSIDLVVEGAPCECILTMHSGVRWWENGLALQTHSVEYLAANSKNVKIHCVTWLHRIHENPAEAPYAAIRTHTERASGGEDLVLTCSTEGYPLAEVYWQEDSTNVSGQLNTSSTFTADGLYNVTSTLRVGLKPGKKYSCWFWNKELQQTTSAELFSAAYHEAAVAESSLALSYIIGPVGIILLVIVLCVAVILRRKCRQKFCSWNDPVNTEIEAHSHSEEAGCLSYTDVPLQKTEPI